METKGQSPQLADLKKLVADCFAPKIWLYWADFLGSCFLGYGALVLTEMVPLFSFAQIVLFFVSVFAIYRAALFIHELTHQERRDLPGFSVAWNLLIGIPALVPSFTYRGVHIDHHKRNLYSTEEDGEYLPLGASPFWKTAAYLSQSLVLPFLSVFRFGILAPLSLTHPKFRRYVMERASALAIRFDTARRIPTGVDLRNWYVLEFLCFFYTLGMALLFITGTLSLGTLFHIYLVMVVMLFLNSLRTVIAHRYRNKDGHELSFQEQLLDSVNLEGNTILAVLLAPVGLRYHGLHHLFPTIPYHNLETAHRRIKAALPPGSFYHQTLEPSIWSALHTHWKNTQSSQRETAEEAISSLRA